MGLSRIGRSSAEADVDAFHGRFTRKASGPEKIFYNLAKKVHLMRAKKAVSLDEIIPLPRFSHDSSLFHIPWTKLEFAIGYEA